MRIITMSPDAWQMAHQAISAGELVVFPTDTVYGVACDPHNPSAIDRLFAAKGRGYDKPIPLLLSDAEQVRSVSPGLNAPALKLGRHLWSGPLTLVVPRAPGLPENLGGGQTIAVRVPGHAELRAFLARCGGYLAVTSANLSGRPDALTADEAAAYLDQSVEIIVDGGAVGGGVPSSVIDCTVSPPALLREGAIPASRIAEILGEPV
ncbi:MAG: L-threonylcarbamoyladenylate synthase [Chloroflexia bacterium]